MWTVISALEEPLSIGSVVLERYKWRLGDTLCPSPENIERMMGTVSAVPGPLFGAAECSFVMESMVHCRECHEHLHLGG